MDFYRIMNEEEILDGIKLKTGINISPSSPFKRRYYVVGGIDFAKEDILAFLTYGPWLRKVTLPNEAYIIESPSKDANIWHADRIILGERERITPNIVERLIQEGANIHANSDWPIRGACAVGDAELVKLLVKSGADLHALGDSSLFLASWKGHFEIVKLLLENGADVNAHGGQALRAATANGQTKIAALLEEWTKK